MNLLIFFALPIATILLAVVFQKILKNPILVALTFFAIYLIVTFTAFDVNFLVYAILYTILAFVTAAIYQAIVYLIRRLDDNDDNYCRTNKYERETISPSNFIESNNKNGSVGIEELNNLSRRNRRLNTSEVIEAEAINTNLANINHNIAGLRNTVNDNLSDIKGNLTTFANTNNNQARKNNSGRRRENIDDEILNSDLADFNDSLMLFENTNTGNKQSRNTSAYNRGRNSCNYSYRRR